MSFPKVYIIVLNYQTWQDTIECIETLLKLQYSNYQIIVVDNASPNGSIDFIKQWAEGTVVLENNSKIFNELVIPFTQKPISYTFLEEKDLYKSTTDRIIIIQSGKNNGYAAGNNIAFKYILDKNDYEYAWVLNNDTAIEPLALYHLVEKAEYNKKNRIKVGLLGSKIMFYNQPNIIQCAGGAKYYKWLSHDVQIGNMQIDKGQFDNENLKLDFIVGACTFFTKAFIEDVGIFTEDYFLYFEEIDLAARARNKKWGFGYVFQSKVYHKEGATTGGGTLIGNKKRSDFSEFYHFKSRVLYNRKHGNIIDKFFVNIGFLTVILSRLIKGEWQKAWLRFKIWCNPYKAKYN